jgi:hypothetical protein
LLLQDAEPKDLTWKPWGGGGGTVASFSRERGKRGKIQIGGLGSSHTVPFGAAVPARPPTRPCHVTRGLCGQQWFGRARVQGTRVVVRSVYFSECRPHRGTLLTHFLSARCRGLVKYFRSCRKLIVLPWSRGNGCFSGRASRDSAKKSGDIPPRIGCESQE